MVKYKKVFKEMLEENQKLFNQFRQIHDNYLEDKSEWEDKFNEEGTRVLRVIRRYENTLCAKSENSGYSKFSSNLSDKFWKEIRGYFPAIDKIRVV